MVCDLCVYCGIFSTGVFEDHPFLCNPCIYFYWKAKICNSFVIKVGHLSWYMISVFASLWWLSAVMHIQQKWHSLYVKSNTNLTPNEQMVFWNQMFIQFLAGNQLYDPFGQWRGWSCRVKKNIPIFNARCS